MRVVEPSTSAPNPAHPAAQGLHRLWKIALPWRLEWKNVKAVCYELIQFQTSKFKLFNSLFLSVYLKQKNKPLRLAKSLKRKGAIKYGLNVDREAEWPLIRYNVQ